MNIKSRTHNRIFRLVEIDYDRFLVWFVYDEKIYPKSLLIVEEYKTAGRSKGYITDITYPGIFNAKAKQRFHRKHKGAMEETAMKFREELTAQTSN